MPRLRGRWLLAACAILVALLILLFPPWRVRAIRATTRYVDVAGVAPATVVDTVNWTLGFLPVWSPPRPTLSGSRMRDLTVRSLNNDRAARAELLDAADDFERRTRAPDVLRTAGALWRDSVLAAAGIPSVSAYDAFVTLDETRIVTRIAILAAVTILLDWWRTRARVPRRERERSH